MATETILKLQSEVSEILDRIDSAREWMQAADALREMIEITPDEGDQEFVYETWLGIYRRLFPAMNGKD